VTCSHPSSDRPGGSDAEQQNRRDPHDHEQEIPQTHRPPVFLLSAQQIAQRRELEADADTPAQQMEQDRDCGTQSE
jgi:hypothetical protein